MSLKHAGIWFIHHLTHPTHTLTFRTLPSRHGILLFIYTSKFCKLCFTQAFLSIFNVKCGNISKFYTKYKKCTQALLAGLSIIPCLTLLCYHSDNTIRNILSMLNDSNMRSNVLSLLNVLGIIILFEQICSCSCNWKIVLIFWTCHACFIWLCDICSWLIQAFSEQTACSCIFSWVLNFFTRFTITLNLSNKYIYIFKIFFIPRVWNTE